MCISQAIFHTRISHYSYSFIDYQGGGVMGQGLGLLLPAAFHGGNGQERASGPKKTPTDPVSRPVFTGWNQIRSRIDDGEI